MAINQKPMADRYFVFKNNKRVHRINRETGQVIYKNLTRDNAKENYWENCEIISSSEFYARTGEILKTFQEEMKIHVD